MQLTHHHHAAPADGLLVLTWKIVAGIAVAVGVIFLGTVAIESTLPELPDQARASQPRSMPDPTAAAVMSRAAEPAPVEHFHAQFRLQPGADAVQHVEAF